MPRLSGRFDPVRRQAALVLSPAYMLDFMRAKLAGDTGMVALTVLAQNLLRVVGSMILTRLLTAEAFGVVGIITSISVTLALVSDVGIDAYIIRSEKSGDGRFLDQVWTLKLVRAAVLTTVMMLAAGPIAQFLGKPELQWPIAVGGLFFVFDGLQSLAFQTALRERRVKRMSVIDIASQVAGLAVSVLLALWFRNYWGIIVSGLVGQLLRALLSYICFPDALRRWSFSRERVREMWLFSRFITGSTIITLIISQTDKVVLSKVFPLHTFGLYMLAAGLAAAPVGLAATYAARILFPAYSVVVRDDPAAIGAAFYRQKRLTSLGYLAAVGMFIGLAPIVVRLLYDDRYLSAGFYLQILLVSPLLYLNTMAINEVMIARGNAKFTLTVNVVRLIFLAVGGTLAYQAAGPFGLIWTVGVVEAPAQLYGWMTLYRHGLLRWREEASLLAVGAAGCGLGTVATLLLSRLF